MVTLSAWVQVDGWGSWHFSHAEP